MSQTLYHKVLIIFLFLTMIFSKSISPIQLDSEETLKIYGKDRSYYRLVNNNLTYYVEGSKVLNIYSRLAFPDLTKRIKPYKFKVIIDEADSFIVDHHFKVDPNVSARIHPRHAYTNAGLDIINIKKGTHRIELVPLDSNLNVLIRLVEKPFKAFEDAIETNLSIQKNDGLNEKVLKVGNKNLKYFSISDQNMNNKLFFDTRGPSTIKVTSRVTFKEDEKQGYYQFKIRQNSKLISTHHMFSEISKGANIRKSKWKVSKFKTTFISVPDNEHQYEIEVMYPKDREILFRLDQEK